MNYLQTKCNKSKKSGRNVLRWCNKILAVTFFVCCALLFKSILAGFSFVQEDETIFRSRRLLALVAWEQCDFEIGHERNYSFRESWWAPNEAYGWLTLYIICVLIIFVALAIVCDDFFVPSLEAISEKLDLSEDVAGATFMAAGSSAPELFTSVAGVTQQSDVGVGTIVGSAIFNLLVIIALTAALAGQVLQLDWRPLCRDSICYALSIGFFIWFSWDGKFEFYESAILLLLYVFYIVLMKFNYKLMDLLSGIGPKTGQISPQVTETVHIVTDVESPLGNKARDGAPSTNPDADHGTPPGKLPPLPRTTDNLDPSAVPSDHHKPHKHFAHSHKGELSRSISNLALGRSQHSSDVMTRLSVSFPILRDLKNGEKTNRRSSESHLHEHHHIRIKSIAQGQVRKEMRRRSELLRSETGRFSLPTNQQTVTIVEVEANGNVLPPDSGQISPIESQAVFEKADNEANSVEDEEPTIKVLPCLKPVSAEIPVYPEGKKSLLKTMKYVVGWLLFMVSFPFICLFTWTIPDCSKPHNRKYFMVSFFMSIVWIALLSLAMVTLVGRSGCILSVDKFTMGLVVVAIGTSVPDALSSILVARDGFGDMAVSNAIGSNVFDINLGLGLPFVIACLINNMDPIHLLSPEEEAILEADGMIMVPHAKFGFLLLLILVIALVVFVLVRFTLKRIVGVCFVVMYILFVAYAYIQDLYCQHSC